MLGPYRRYFRQTLLGCTTESCPAAQQPVARDPPDAATIAFSLAQTSQAYTCPHAEAVPDTFGVSLGDLEQLYNECQATGDFEAMSRMVSNTFGTSPSLASSFLDTTGSVDKYSVQQAYALLIHKCPSNVKEAFLKGILEQLRLLKSLDLTPNVDTSKLLPLLVILLQNPLLLDPESHAEVLPSVCEVLCKLPQYHHPVLCHDLLIPPSSHIIVANGPIHNKDDHEYMARELEHLIGIFHHFVTLRLLSRTDDNMTPNRDVAIMNATKCLAMFYEANERYHLIPYTEFYNDAVNEQLDIKEDFPHFKDRKGFTFCDYPFILNPAIKADILKVESMFQMRHELQDAFFRALFQGVNSPYLVLEIHRDSIIRDALHQLECKSPKDLKKQLRVQFVGEDGVDEGGVQKEFFQLVVREMFDPKYGMFVTNEESRLCWFNSSPMDDELTIDEFKLIGLLLGLAVYNGIILDVHFPLALYRKLMGQSVGLEDLKQLDPTLGKGLEQLLEFEGDVETTYDRPFQVDLNAFDQSFIFDLVEGGASIKLTKHNRRKFVDCYADFILNKSVECQFMSFKEGFDLVCHDSAIRLFRPEEVEQLICGSPELDFEALEQATHYDGGWTKDSKIIKEFWEIVHEFTEEQKKRLLFFTTGSDRVPINGLGKLQFVIAKNGGDSDRLPTSHTCYSVLLLYEYSSKEKLRERLLTAIGNAEGFGMI